MKFICIDSEGLERRSIVDVINIYETKEYYLVETDTHMYTVWLEKGWNYVY